MCSLCFPYASEKNSKQVIHIFCEMKVYQRMKFIERMRTLFCQSGVTRNGLTSSQMRGGGEAGDTHPHLLLLTMNIVLAKRQMTIDEVANRCKLHMKLSATNLTFIKPVQLLYVHTNTHTKHLQTECHNVCKL